VIRYRKGLAMIKDDFHTVCSWTQFPAKNSWKYDLLLGERKSSIVLLMTSVNFVTGPFN